MTSHPQAPLTVSSPSARGTQAQEAHLSEVQIDDFIIGDPEPSAVAHLASCPLCAERLTSASSSLSSFNSLAMTWSERISASLPAPLPPQKPFWFRPLAVAAPCFVLIVGVMVLHTTYVGENAPRATRSTAIDDSLENQLQQSRVSADDRMLNAIESDMNPDADTAANLGLRPVSADVEASSASSVRD